MHDPQIRPTISTRVALAMVLALVASPAALAATPDRSGVYGDVTISPVTTDAGGYQVEITDKGEASSIVFTICEGGCSGGKTWPASVRGKTITFSVTDELQDRDGAVVQRETVRYLGEFRGGRLILTSPDRSDLRAKLKRLKRARPGQTAELANY